MHNYCKQVVSFLLLLSLLFQIFTSWSVGLKPVAAPTPHTFSLTPGYKEEETTGPGLRELDAAELNKDNDALSDADGAVTSLLSLTPPLKSCI